jgi:hypothetical protein
MIKYSNALIDLSCYAGPSGFMLYFGGLGIRKYLHM